MTTLDSEKIIHELQELWDQLDHERADSGGVLRACAMTLVVTAEDESDAAEVRRTLGVLMHDHPSRAVVIRNAGDHGAEVDARVFAECWRPFGSTQQICSEGVEVTANASRLNQVAQLLVPLRVPDLPLVLWCRGGRAFSPGAFDALYPLADKIIVDSSRAGDARAALDFLRSLRAKGFRVSDLHWTRLTGWRELLSNLFDEGALCSPDVRQVRVLYGGAEPSTCALYFASWIGRALPSAQVSLETHQDGHGLYSITLSTAKDTVTLTRSGSSVEVSGCGRQYRSALPTADEEALMREELKILGADPVYDRVLA